MTSRLTSYALALAVGLSGLCAAAPSASAASVVITTDGYRHHDHDGYRHHHRREIRHERRHIRHLRREIRRERHHIRHERRERRYERHHHHHHRPHVLYRVR